MTERENKPERISEIEFWDGHHWRDKCPWSRIADVLFPSQEQQESIFRRLRRFIKSERQIIRRLSKGDQFLISDYPVGTILSIDYDSNDFGSKRYGIEFWGVVDQVESDRVFYDVVIGCSRKSLEQKSRPLWMRTFCEDPDFAVTLGEVIHSRERGNIPFSTGFPTFDFMVLFNEQSLFRYNKVEVWSYGRGVRRREREPERFGRVVREPFSRGKPLLGVRLLGVRPLVD